MRIIEYKPIGIIHTPFKSLKDAPNQPNYNRNIEGRIEIFPEYIKGLKDLDRCSHLILIYHLHLCKGCDLVIKSHADNKPHGIFTCRASCRPNSIGISVVRLKKIEKSVIYILDVDVVDETPLLDIKPYVPSIDSHEDASVGWIKEKVKKFHT